MPAGVHNPLNLRFVLYAVVFFLNGQGVHIAAQRERFSACGPVGLAFDCRHDAVGSAHIRFVRDTGPAQQFGNFLGRFFFQPGQFGVRVQMVAQRDNLGQNRVHALA